MFPCFIKNLASAKGSKLRIGMNMNQRSFDRYKNTGECDFLSFFEPSVTG